MPFVNIFDEFLPSELMIVRGVVSMLIILPLSFSRITRPESHVLAFALLFSIATIPFFSAMRVWGSGLTLVVLTCTPLVQVTAKLVRGERVPLYTYFCLAVLLSGVAIALDLRSGTFSTLGLGLSVAATILVGLSFEVLGSQKNIDPYHKTFWLAMMMAIVGAVYTFLTGHFPLAGVMFLSTERMGLFVLMIGMFAGCLYFLANVIAFEHLETETASMLAMAETPMVLVGAYFILGEELNKLQWGGVAVALGATLVYGQLKRRDQQTITATT